MSHHQPQEQRVSTGTTPSTAASHIHTPPSSVPLPPTATPPAPTPFQPRPQPYVPQRSSRQLRPPPPRHMLTDWEKEFISKNKDEIYDLLLVGNYLKTVFDCKNLNCEFFRACNQNHKVTLCLYYYKVDYQYC